MAEARTAARGRAVPVYEELVPLQEACAAAYHVLIEGPHETRRDDIERARRLIAIALSRVATLYRVSDGVVAPLDEGQVQACLFSGTANEADLHSLFIRRAALLSAVESLKMARLFFGSTGTQE